MAVAFSRRFCLQKPAKAHELAGRCCTRLQEWVACMHVRCAQVLRAMATHSNSKQELGARAHSRSLHCAWPCDSG